MSNLKRIREEKNITQAKLSEISGVNLQMIQKYEQGVKDINKAQGITLYTLSQALDCKVEDLLEVNFLIGDDLSKSTDPTLVPRLKKQFEQIKKEVEE